MEGYPGYKLAADGPHLAVAYSDDAGVMRFGVIDVESESIVTAIAPGGPAYPFSIRRTADGWEVLWVTGGLPGIDRWSSTTEFVDRTPFGAPAGPVLPDVGEVTATRFGFATVLRGDSPEVDPFWLATYSTAGMVLGPIHVPEELYAPAVLEYSGSIQSLGDDTVVLMPRASSPSEIVTLIVSVSDLASSERATNAAVFARSPIAEQPQHGLHSTGSELVIGESPTSDWSSGGLRFVWLDSSFAPLGEWQMAASPGVFGYSAGAAGAFPRQALLAMGTQGGTADDGSLYFGLASGVAEVPNGMSVVANGVALDRDRLVWESGSRRYSVAFWRSGLEILTFDCEVP
ncbi:MAG: hypothetical protein IT379_22230 [Deltaproteobacteria bacterium]|nr:hypothetical protein [Deltaproteobacteria bacterium]